MAENTVTTGNQALAAGGPAQEKTFTQEDVDRIVKERLARAKAAPPADYDELKAKAAKYDEAQEAAKSELERANERAAKAEAELEEARARMAREALVSKVSEASGVPASLLHGSTEAELAASAEAISEWAKAQRPGYPSDKGGGASGAPSVTVDSIESIKDPHERIIARAAHRNLYQ